MRRPKLALNFSAVLRRTERFDSVLGDVGYPLFDEHADIYADRACDVGYPLFDEHADIYADRASSCVSYKMGIVIDNLSWLPERWPCGHI